MPYTILISPVAAKDLQAVIDYYNEKAENLGYRFFDQVDDYFNRIALVPTASAIRYKNVRCKPMTIFPYLIMYTIDEKNLIVNILRIFNTWQEPLW
jgi:mRNA-degrading endonuclease RelE of RelBE toxin-antitoxin system